MRYRHGNRTICTLIALWVMVVSLTISGCGGGSGGSDFSGATISDIENSTFTFSDGRIFGLEGQVVTLTIMDFEGDNTALFTLETNPMAEGSITIEEGTVLNLFASSNCTFTVTGSDFTEAPLRPGDDPIPTECLISDDGRQLQLMNMNTGQVSTGILEP